MKTENIQTKSNKNKVSKKLQEFINSIANVGKSNIPGDDGMIYYSKIDGAYLTRVGMEKDLEFLLKKGITEQIQDGYGEPTTCCIGFNPTEQKWYGWSHRAIFGFGIGSECKKGNCGYHASNEDEYIEQVYRFWEDKEYSVGDERIEIGIGDGYGKKNVKGVYFRYTYNNKVPNINLRGTEYVHFDPFPDKYGKGEWTANTLEDAKQMAIDFAESVS